MQWMVLIDCKIDMGKFRAITEIRIHETFIQKPYCVLRY